MGTTVVSNTDEEFAALQAAGCVMGHFYKTLHTSGIWLQERGVKSDPAARYIAACYKTLLAEAIDRVER